MDKPATELDAARIAAWEASEQTRQALIREQAAHALVAALLHAKLQGATK